MSAKKHEGDTKHKDWSKVVNKELTKEATVASKEHEKESQEAVLEKEHVTPVKKPALLHSEYAELEKKLNEAEAKANEYWNSILRIKAENDNMLRRAERDIASAHKYALEKFVKELLPVVDSLERGMDSIEPENELTKSIYSGTVLTRDMFLKTLARFGVEQIDPMGETFNPDLHEAMSMCEDKDAKPHTVVQVVQKGYSLNQRLLRPALVIVAK